jgi:ketosteroid isomerase-like protein
MKTEQNKEIVRRYFNLTREGNFQGTFDLMSEDFILCGMGMPPLAYQLTKDQIKEAVKGVATETAEPLIFNIVGITAEGNRVAVESERHTKLLNGSVYHNRYHFLFIVNDGLISTIKEYLCTYTLHNHVEVSRAPS